MPGADLSDNRRRSPKKKKSSKKMNTALTIVIVLSLVCVAAAAAAAMPFIIGGVNAQAEITDGENEPVVPVVTQTDKIYDGIFINGISVGGLTKDEAQKKLNSEFDKELEGKINLVFGNESFTYGLKDMGVAYDINAAVEAAYSIGRQGDSGQMKEAADNARDNHVKLEAALGYDKNYVASIIDTISKSIDKPSVNAYMERSNGEFIITPEENGIAVDKEATLEGLINAIINKESVDVTIATREIVPEYTEAAFMDATKLIGSYYTVIAGSEAGRNQNLTTAAAKINDRVVYPGEIFSTNEAFGEMTTDNGYRMAPVIMGGELINGMGGGVCQVSSTLYMALLHAEVEIVERRNHSQKVGYADYGYDATLAGDYIDLKFRNDTDYPITIEAHIKDSRVQVNLYGHEVHSSMRRLEFYNVFTGSVSAPDERIVEDSSLPPGEREVKTTARNGVNYDLYKIVYENNVETAREWINTSKYAPRGAVVHVGPGEPPETADSTDTAVPAYAPDSETLPGEISEPAETEPPPANIGIEFPPVINTTPDPDAIESPPVIDIP